MKIFDENKDKTKIFDENENENKNRIDKIFDEIEIIINNF